MSLATLQWRLLPPELREAYKSRELGQRAASRSCRDVCLRSVLRAIFEEFVSEGLIDERSFETFIAEARPIVRILDPEDLERFVKQKAVVATPE